MPEIDTKTPIPNADWYGFYSTAQVSRLARVPRQTLYAWKSRGIIKPSVAIMDGDQVVDEGYSYADLTIIKIIRAIRDEKLNLRSASVALRHLIDRFGHPTKGWARTRVYVVNNSVYAEQSDEWEVTAATRHGQKVETRLFGEIFDVLRDMEEKGDILLPIGFSECITINPNVMNGDPVIKNTRIPTAVIAAKFHKGTTMDRLAELYKPIHRHCIEKAIDYEGYLNSPITKAGEPTAGR